MKSKITIDLAEDNQPIIQINYIPSEDVRDKMIKRFLETFGHSSVWSRIVFHPGTEITVATIRPIPFDEIKHNIADMQSLMPQPVTFSQAGESQFEVKITQ